MSKRVYGTYNRKLKADLPLYNADEEIEETGLVGAEGEDNTLYLTCPRCSFNYTIVLVASEDEESSEDEDDEEESSIEDPEAAPKEAADSEEERSY